MGTISLTLPVIGQPNSTEDPKVATAFSVVESEFNGNIDAVNLSAVLAQSAGVNQVAQVTKGVLNTATSQSTSSNSYVTLATPDQVRVVLPTNGMIAVWFQALWQESVQSAGRAAIFLGASQLQVQAHVSPGGAPQTQAAMLGSATVGVSVPLFTHPAGLASPVSGGAYSPNVTTGQAVGYLGSACNVDLGGVTSQIAALTPLGGPCYVFASAGTYTVSVQFSASSGTVTALSRTLWVQALAFG